MTIDETISIIREMKRQSQIIKDNPTTFYSSKDMAAGIKTMKKHIEAYDIAISALRAQQEAEKNEPLTLEELREMDCPVWICYKQETWGPQHPLADNMSCSRYQFCFEDYGKTWLAYRHQPRRKENAMVHIKVGDNGIIVDTSAEGNSFQIAGEIAGAVRTIYYAISQADEDAAEEFRFAVSTLLQENGKAWDTSAMKKTGSGLCCMAVPADEEKVT